MPFQRIAYIRMCLNERCSSDWSRWLTAAFKSVDNFRFRENVDIRPDSIESILWAGVIKSNRWGSNNSQEPIAIAFETRWDGETDFMLSQWWVIQCARWSQPNPFHSLLAANDNEGHMSCLPRDDILTIIWNTFGTHSRERNILEASFRNEYFRNDNSVDADNLPTFVEIVKKSRNFLFFSSSCFSVSSSCDTSQPN